MTTKPDDDALSHFPVNGGTMRQKDKPWIALGISRATWYRHGKPVEWHKRSTNKDEAALNFMSLRTFERFMRVGGSGSKLLIGYVIHGGMKLGMADYLLAHPSVLRRFRAWHRRARTSPSPENTNKQTVTAPSVAHSGGGI
jgi:hypothetical protein